MSVQLAQMIWLHVPAVLMPPPPATPPPPPAGPPKCVWEWRLCTIITNWQGCPVLLTALTHCPHALPVGSPTPFFPHLFVCEWFQAVQRDQNEAACACCADDLPSTTLAIFCSLNNTRQIQHLDLCSTVAHNAWHTRKRGELIRRSLHREQMNTVSQGTRVRGTGGHPQQHLSKHGKRVGWQSVAKS